MNGINGFTTTARLALVATMCLGLANGAAAFLAGDGKGKPDRDCYIGLDGYSQDDLSPINKKQTKFGIRCTDCDPTCDLDGIAEPNGSCVFRIAACVNNSDVPGCDPATRTPKKVSAKAKSKGGKFDLGGTLPGDLSSACSSFMDFPVPVKGKQQNKPGKGKVTLLAKKPTDKDKFTFICDPLPEGESCPVPSTTTSTTIISSSTTTTTLPMPICGDATLDPGEECDDGNVNPTDGCTNDCTICGNSTVTAPEECDDGNLDAEDGCAPNCTTEGCGNGLIEGFLGETCDDGNTDDGDNCPSGCIIEECLPNVDSDFTVNVDFDSGGGSNVAGLTLFVDYPEGKVSIPGSGSNVPSGIITNLPGFALGQTNDLDYAVQEVLIDSFNFPDGLAFSIHFETCMGQSAPTAGEFTCTVLGASADTGDPVQGVTCTASVVGP
jgi:cysteine-rich repeat protein